MKFVRVPKLAVALFVAALVIAFPVLADEIRGKIKSIDRARSEIVVADEKTESDVTVSLSTLSKGMGKTERPQKAQGRNAGHDRKRGRGGQDHDRWREEGRRRAQDDRFSRSSGTISGTTCSSHYCCSSIWGFWCRSSRWNLSFRT